MRNGFLEALACKNTGRPPVWLMRQAGRYLPEYRSLRQIHSLSTLFHTPKLAAEVTLQPIRRFDFDAAIIFSDILVVLEMLGLTIHFPEGKSPYVDFVSLEEFRVQPARKVLSYVASAIELVKPKLAVPLIGFCGGPYTVARYLLGIERMQEWMQTKPQALHQLLGMITEATIDYLQMQSEAVDALQIFDSWAGLLPRASFMAFSLPYLQRLVKSVSLPVILFMRGAGEYVEELCALGPSGISFDEQKPLSEVRKKMAPNIAIQGNLDPQTLLMSTPEEVREKTQALLLSMQDDPGFIVNLGHGILPATPLENVQAFIDTIRLLSKQRVAVY